MDIPVNPAEFNREFIDKLALDNPIVHNFLKPYHLGFITYEQALIGMIAHLHIHNEELIKLNYARISNSIYVQTDKIPDWLKQDIK